jgi:hypothetical protein
MKNIGPQSFKFLLCLIVVGFCVLEIAPDYPFDSLTPTISLVTDGVLAFIALIAMVPLLKSLKALATGETEPVARRNRKQTPLLG